MADTSLLASIISGTDPLSLQMLQGQQGAQLGNAALDPNFGHNEGLFGALAKTLAGFRGNDMLRSAVEDVSSQRTAARPELVNALANPAGPVAYAQQHPDMNSLNLASVLSLKPEDLQNYIEAARLGRANSPGAQPLVPTNQNPALPGWGKVNGPVPSASPARNPSMPQGDVSALGTGRPAAPAADVDVSGIASLPAEKQAEAIAKMNPQQKAILAAKLNRLKAQRTQTTPPLNPPT